MTLPTTTEDTRLQFRCDDHVETLPLSAIFERPQEHTYRDTPGEVLNQIVAEIEGGRPWREVVNERYAEAHPWLHQIITSPKRDLFFRQYPALAHGRILDVGAGWGQLALPLAAQGDVCALEPTPERLRFIRAAARQDGLDARMWFINADYFDIEFEDRFDLITCVGVLEWVPKFSPGDDPVEIQRRFLRKLRRDLAPGGTLVIGIENRFGLKYLMGAADDHIGHANIAAFDAALAQEKWRAQTGQELRCFTFTRAELDLMLTDAGFATREFFAAFPDYKIPDVIEALGDGLEQIMTRQVVPEHDGSNGISLSFQRELSSHYCSLAHLRIASNFVPSFFVAAGTTK